MTRIPPSARRRRLVNQQRAVAHLQHVRDHIVADAEYRTRVNTQTARGRSFSTKGDAVTMTDPMTPERLAEIEARANAATQGPWEWHPYMGSGATLAKPNHPFHELNILKTTDDWPPVAADAEFIAAARTDVPALLAEVRRLQAAVERVRELHKPVPVYAHADECGCGNEDHALIESAQGDDLCWDTPTGAVRCCECLDEDGGGVEYPCPAIAALDGADQ